MSNRESSNGVVSDELAGIDSTQILHTLSGKNYKMRTVKMRRLVNKDEILRLLDKVDFV